MKQSRATIRYAKSLIDISEENGVIDSSYDDMLLINSICLSNKDLVNLLKTPIVKTDLKVKILKELFSNSISKLTLSFIILITNKKRESLLAEICSSFISLYKNKKKY